MSEEMPDVLLEVGEWDWQPSSKAYARWLREVIDEGIFQSLETLKPEPQQPSRWQMKRVKWKARHA